MSEVGVGEVRVSDGAVLALKVLIVDVKEVQALFAPFGGVDFTVNVVGGVSIKELPQDVRKLIENKPVSTTYPSDGWELMDIVNQREAVASVVVDSSRGKFQVIVRAEAVMVARNVNYKTAANEPFYWLNWVYKISWRPVKG